MFDFPAGFVLHVRLFLAGRIAVRLRYFLFFFPERFIIKLKPVCFFVIIIRCFFVSSVFIFTLKLRGKITQVVFSFPSCLFPCSCNMYFLVLLFVVDVFLYIGKLNNKPPMFFSIYVALFLLLMTFTCLNYLKVCLY